MVIATICARAGSKGVKNKNIVEVAGKPLIQYTLECAEESSLIDYYIVSTDSKAFLRVIEGIQIPLNKRICKEYVRPVYLAEDDTPKIHTILHAIEYAETKMSLNTEIIVDLDIGCPLRRVEDLDEAVRKLKSHREYDCLTTVYPADRNPYFNMLEKKEDGKYGLVKEVGRFIARRQDAPSVWNVSPAAMLWRRDKTEVRHLLDGNWGILEVSSETAIDIDSPFELMLVRFLMSEANTK